jgi:GTPase SAR1 family protein
MTTDSTNINFQLAADFIQYTNRSVFLTGKAGTGKTTFLKYIKSHSVKQTAVLAPTGVAAINAGGVTIHSFFQLPFSPFIPGSKGFKGDNEGVIDKHGLLDRIRLTGDRKKILQQLELLIIDEISMVRCDVLDAIDTVLQHFRNRQNEPFGGVQVLLIGDMYQLPPVVKEEEWQLLCPYYSSPYFFDSQVIQLQSPVYIELDKIYRQSDHHFISVLNKVRNNELDEEAYHLLNRQYQPQFRPDKKEGYITLTTHNHKADSINAGELAKLNHRSFTFKASVTGDFNEKSYPADETLQLKVGAQVMFIKNDVEKIRRYFNGKIGIIDKIEEDKIFVLCNGETVSIEVKKEVWKNIRYSLDKKTQQLEEDEIGSFTQYPLRLAWAITIHKSQGLTFEKAVIDAGTAFAPGQVYVALSRCTSLQGIVLSSQITKASLFSDEHITHFSDSRVPAQLPKELMKDKYHYQSKVLIDLFDFTQCLKICSDLKRGVEEHLSSFNKETLPWIEEIGSHLSGLQEVGKKFQQQLLQLLQQQEVLPEHNGVLQERVKAAARYFNERLQWLVTHLSSSPAVTDSRQFAMAYNEDSKELHSSLALQAELIRICQNGFDTETYHQYKNSFVLPSFTVNAYASASGYKKTDSPHPLLHKLLRQLRDSICDKGDIPVYFVAGTTTLDEMARYLPQTPEELIQINGFGKAKADRYGQQFLEVIINYCTEHHLSSLISEKKSKKEKKLKPEKVAVPLPDTKTETFRLYQEGKTVTEIADQRGLTRQTIETHLAHFVARGEIKVEELVSREKIVLIGPALKNFDGKSSISPIKEQLGEGITYGEIRLVLAGKEFEEQK